MSAPWRIAERAVVFSGTPPVLTGEVSVVNETAEKVTPKGVSIRGEPDQQLQGELRLPARLQPKGQARIRAHLRVDRSTPPGTYRATIEGGSQKTPATVHVYDLVSTRAQPSLLRFSGTGGDKVELHVTLTNAGNVPQHLQSSGAIYFEEANWVGRSLVFALRKAEPGDGVQKLLDRAVEELRGSMIGTTSVSIDADGEWLGPGRTQNVVISFTLPQGLSKGRIYGAWLDLAGAHLTFELHCNGSPKSSQRRPA